MWFLLFYAMQSEFLMMRVLSMSHPFIHNSFAKRKKKPTPSLFTLKSCARMCYLCMCGCTCFVLCILVISLVNFLIFMLLLTPFPYLLNGQHSMLILFAKIDKKSTSM